MLVGLRTTSPPFPGGRELEVGGDSGGMILDLFRPALSKVEGICNLEFKIVRMDKLKNFAANISPDKEN
jgi:hypothetical protein